VIAALLIGGGLNFYNPETFGTEDRLKIRHEDFDDEANFDVTYYNGLSRVVRREFIESELLFDIDYKDYRVLVYSGQYGFDDAETRMSYPTEGVTSLGVSILQSDGVICKEVYDTLPSVLDIFYEITDKLVITVLSEDEDQTVVMTIPITVKEFGVYDDSKEYDSTEEYLYSIKEVPGRIFLIPYGVDYSTESTE